MQGLGGRRILVVEDDPLIAMDMQHILEDAGGVVIGPAGSLASALAIVEKNQVDAAVLDVRLETGDSLPLANVLRERGVPFLFQTSDPDLIQGLYAGVPVLRKPFRPAELVAELSALVNIHEA
jgi:DNA-binding response OmpR family regulator